MVNISEFLDNDKSMIIAPAGYGKTHTIIDCLLQNQGQGKILILTHTHAGIASIRGKIKDHDIPTAHYHIDTICSFALQMSQIYHIDKADFPKVEKSNAYFDFAITTAIKILQARPIQEVIKSKYSHVIVDEYQDCSEEQHVLILKLSAILKTHILGDPLQGIFEFRHTRLIDMESDPSMEDFKNNKQELQTPWRWVNAHATQLGIDLASIRNELLAGRDVDLRLYRSITLVNAQERDYTIPDSSYKNAIWHEINQRQIQSLLLIHPVAENESPREEFIKRFPPLRMIESIDNKKFYDYCNLFDSKTGQNLIEEIVKFSQKFFTKTVVDAWFRSDYTLKNKRGVDAKKVIPILQSLIDSLVSNKNYSLIAELIEQIKDLPNNKCNRSDFMRDLISALRNAHSNKISAYEAMKRNRDIIRREGRNIIGKCIGTTLLTKGLEFDSVIVLNAHKFNNPKHLYVALTRACKRLTVITENPILHPYSN